MAVPFWFDQTYYIAAKAANDKKEPAVTQGELDAAGYTGVEGAFRHYEEWGKLEKVAPFDPATFDADAYLAAKAANDGKDVAVTTKELADAGISPIEHFMLYAEEEKIDYQLSDAPVDPDQPVDPEQPGEDVSEVAAALDAYQGASKALEDGFEAAEVEGMTEAGDNVDDTAAVLNAIFANVLTGTGGTVSADSSDTYDNAVIAEQKAALEKDLAGAKEAAERSDIASAKAVVAAEASYEDAIAEAVEAETDFAAALAGYNKAHNNGGGTLLTAFGSVSGGEYTADAIDLENLEANAQIVTIPTPAGDTTTLSAAYDAGTITYTLTLSEGDAEALAGAAPTCTLSGDVEGITGSAGTTATFTAGSAANEYTATVTVSPTADLTDATLTLTVDSPSIAIDTTVSYEEATAAPTATPGPNGTVDTDSVLSATYDAETNTITYKIDLSDTDAGNVNSVSDLGTWTLSLTGDNGEVLGDVTNAASSVTFTQDTTDTSVYTATVELKADAAYSGTLTLASGTASETIEVEIEYTPATPADPTVEPGADVTAAGAGAEPTDVIITNADGELVLGERGKDLAETSTWPQQLLDALKAYQESVVDLGDARDSLESEVAEVLGVEKGDASVAGAIAVDAENAVTVALGAAGAAAQAIIDAENALADFTKAVEDFTDAKAVYAELNKLEEAYNAAYDAIVDPVEDGGLGLNLLAANNFTADSDLYVVDEGTNASLSKFGFAGEDMIFFGSKYSFVEATTTDIKESWGKADAFEVFYEQDGKDLVLYMENVAAAGNATNDSDMTVITLTGVQIADVTFADGFALAGEASA